MEVPSHRACAHCRSQKVRCLPDESNPEVCQRCARSGRPCVFTPMQKRKQRKRTDTRVAELEREMRAMRAALLKDKSEGEPSEKPSNLEAIKKDTAMEAQDDFEVLSATKQQNPTQGQSELLALGRLVQRRSDQPSRGDARGRAEAAVGREKSDVVDRSVLSMEGARRLVDHYKKNLYPQCPMVYIPDTCTADELRQERPILFLAVIAAAAGVEDQKLAGVLDNEVLQEYATRSVVRSEKSVELVQALLISAVWYIPPSKFSNLKYYEYIHMAATMASDIGITTRPSKLNRSRFAARNGAPTPSLHPSEDVSNPDLSMSIRPSQEAEGTGNLECRRTFLACYSICVGISISLRRPAMMRVTTYTRECVDYIENSPHATFGDRILVAWTRLWMIGEEIGTALEYDDPGDTASILDTTTQVMVTAFEKRLTEWRSRVTEQDFVPCLKIMYLTLRLFLHELVLHIDHSPEDFKAPYQMGAIHPWEVKNVPVKPVVGAIVDLVQSSHSLIDTFVEMGPDAVRCLPVFYYVRVSFAAFILAKLCLSAHSQHSQLASNIDSKGLNAEIYVDKLILFVQSLTSSKGSHVPSLFLALLFKLRQWCSHPELIEQAEAQGASSDIWPEGVKKAQAQIALEGPRITEAMGSSAEPSPEMANEVSRTNNLWNTPAAWAGEEDLLQQYVASGSIDPGKQQDRVRGSHGQSITIPNTPNSDDFARVNLEGYQEVFARFDPVNTASATQSAGGTNAAGASTGQWSVSDQMDLDSNMMHFLEDMGDFTHGGLTGLDDWMNFSEDFGPVQVDFPETSAHPQGQSDLADSHPTR